MRIKLTFISSILFFVLGFSVWMYRSQNINYGAPPYLPEGPPGEEDSREARYNLDSWVRPVGPPKVGIQAGHWKNNELPDELERLRGSSGTSHQGLPEWQVNLSIAQEIKNILESKGVVVEILPATIPPGYYADAVVAVHADGSLDPKVRGFKVASPRRDRSGKAVQLKDLMTANYGAISKLPFDDNITRNMTGYYAFSWRRFDHATHPMAPAVIVETGFLTNAADRNLLTNNPRLLASAIAQSLIEFLKS